MVCLVPFISLVAISQYVMGQVPADEDPRLNPNLERHSVCNPEAGSIHQFMVETLDGQNYLEFNSVVSKYRNQGLNFVGFPCNQFDLQEPGKNSEILNGIKYVRPGNGYEPDQDLHIYGKLMVNGENAHPMYKFLKNACPATGARLGTLKDMHFDVAYTYDIVWNFEKFIVDRQGRPRYRFHPAAWQHGKFVEKFLTEVMGADSNSGSPLSANVNQAPTQTQMQIPQQNTATTSSSSTAQAPVPVQNSDSSSNTPQPPVPVQNSESSSNTPQPPVPVQNPGNITLNDIMSGSSAVSTNANGGSSANRGWLQWRQPAQN